MNSSLTHKAYFPIESISSLGIVILISILIYLRANSTAQGPITEGARVKETNNTHKVENKAIYI
jgi:hypothetical protein